MRSRKLSLRMLLTLAVAVVAFATLELLFVQPALANLKCCACKPGTVVDPDGSGPDPGSCTSQNADTLDCICDPSTKCSINQASRVPPNVGVNRAYKFTPKNALGGTIGCSDTSQNTSLANLKASEITCDGISEATFLEATSLQRLGTESCTVTNHPPCITGSEPGCTAVCTFDLTYLKTQGNPPLSICVNNPGGQGTEDDTSTRTYSAFCQDAVTGSTPKLNVSGAIKCPASLNNNVLPAFCDPLFPDCQMKLGLAGITSGQCDDTAPSPGFFPPSGQVLDFSQTVSGLGCSDETAVLFRSDLTTLFCSGGSFDGAAVDCLTGQGKNLFGGGTATAAVAFDVVFTPNSLNLNCGVNNNDTWHFTITGNESLSVANIDVTTSPPGAPAPELQVEGVQQVFNCSKNLAANTLSCDIHACDPNSNIDLGSIACANRNADGSVDLTVTGTAFTGTLAIRGEDKAHKSGGNCTLPTGG